MPGLGRAFAANVKKTGGGKIDERTVTKVRGQGESIIWSVCSEKASRPLSWISKHPAPPEVTSLSLRINNQPLPVWEENRWLCTLDYLSMHARKHARTHWANRHGDVHPNPRCHSCLPRQVNSICVESAQWRWDRPLPCHCRGEARASRGWKKYSATSTGGA